MLAAHRISFDGILQELSLAVAAGEILAVLGPNGAGKSTLLKVLSGEWAPSTGEVSLDGRPLLRWKEAERARSLAVLPQFSFLSAPFTAMEVVLLGRIPHGKGGGRSHDEQVARSALALVEAGHLASAIYPRLSGGEQQSIQLARVLAQIWDAPTKNSRSLLLDEPTANLDLAQQHRMLVVARQFARQGVGVLAILHDLNLAAQYADRIVLMKKGSLLAEGCPEEVLTAERIEQVFEYPVTVLKHKETPLVVANPPAHNAH